MRTLPDTWLRVLGPIGMYVFVALFFRLDWYRQLPTGTSLINDAIALSCGLICWQIARWVVLRIQSRYPGLINTRRRLLRLLIVMPLLVNGAWLLRLMIRYLIDGKFLYFNSSVELSRMIGIQLFYHFIYFVVYEGWYMVQQWQRETIETTTLEKVSLQSQLTSLQHQVNPHFLFNSLNSLSSLINESPRQAETFLEELTSVFRYLLQASDYQLVTLEQEIRFVQSYCHLLTTRYPNGLLLDIEVDEAYQSRLIPPLTLQVLIENAVRYNVILPEAPLHIHIHTTPDQRLLVTNTLRRKNLRVEPHGAGLSNLALQYQLLGEGNLLIEEQPDYFVINLPLIRESRLTESE